jgi:hypothetical protein
MGVHLVYFMVLSPERHKRSMEHLITSPSFTLLPLQTRHPARTIFNYTQVLWAECAQLFANTRLSIVRIWWHRVMELALPVEGTGTMSGGSARGDEVSGTKKWSRKFEQRYKWKLRA